MLRVHMKRLYWILTHYPFTLHNAPVHVYVVIGALCFVLMQLRCRYLCWGQSAHLIAGSTMGYAIHPGVG